MKDKDHSTPDRTCACGACGLPTTGRSRFHEDHRRALTLARRLLRAARKAAARRRETITVSERDVLRLLLARWPRALGLRLGLRRRDPCRPVEPGNLRLVTLGERALDPRGALARCLSGGRHPHLTVDDLVRAWDLQQGRCALTGADMDCSAGAWSPLSPTLLCDDRGRVRLVARAVHAVAAPWGEEVLLAMARAVVQHAGSA